MVLWKYTSNELDKQSSKELNKHVNSDAKRYEIAYLLTCRSYVVLMYCNKSVMTYRLSVVLSYFNISIALCISISVRKCRIIGVVVNCCNDVLKFGLNDVLMQIGKSVIDWRFTSFYQYLFTSLKICINE
jgi:hypothetical protein